MFDFDDLEQRLEAKAKARAKDTEVNGKSGKLVRIWAISDIHTDDHHNKEWVEAMNTTGTANDVIIVAGDISHKWEVIRDTLSFFKARFARVFYCPGNHELWGDAQQDSMRRLHEILDLCQHLGVETQPAEVAAGDRRVLVVPILSWHHPQWDTEPEIEGWRGLIPVDKMLSDYLLTHWPPGIAIQDGTAAKAVDLVNDELTDWPRLLQRRPGFQEVISFSHFLARVETNPEKRYLNYPNLAKGVGSEYLRRRVESLRPDLHVFGHTHFGYDLEVEGIRYVQAPLAMSQERHARGTTVALGTFPEGLPFSNAFKVWDSRNGWAPKSQAAWSAYVERYGRRPDVTWLLPSYVADCGLEPEPSPGLTGKMPKVGWLPGRSPVWFFGPKKQRVVEAAAESRKVSDRLAKEAAGKYRSARLPGTDEPHPIEASEVAMLRQVVVIDVREGECGSRPKGCIELPHPQMTCHFPALNDKELLELMEKLMATEGPWVIVGDADFPASARHAALLLAALLRLWPRDLRPLRGGFRAWVAAGLPVQRNLRPTRARSL